MNIHVVKEVLHESTTNAVVTPNKRIEAVTELSEKIEPIEPPVDR